MDGELELERLGLVPTDVREFVIDRDQSCCRVCGRYVETPALHHIEYRSEGGLDVPSNLVVVGWLPGHDCHLDVVHRSKRIWQPVLRRVAQHPGITALQARRWGVA
ncbi:HNH endonuclease [Nocardioides sp. TRM66260-LWL]|uniref:HNH endonuclease n=1 Tax=Nocardioides sp. TRM66260-LWL TaxID=2874478 RepID=UPI001CC57E07|nr:HNH endonuclease [Nocardioides sp. TRM66260-LWL]MBZ5734073.1 HNH endonuclease [Nocardioides sp. TRM66260-LWL]